MASSRSPDSSGLRPIIELDELDEVLVELLQGRVSSGARRDPVAVLEHAELHGLAAVVQDALAAAGVELPAELTNVLRLRATAREIDHAAHLATLERIDKAFESAQQLAVALKGPLLAERYYAVPSGRATSDTDLMVAEAELERATELLRSLGYEPATGAEEERFRREHHHLHFFSPIAPPLELHFHAYRGFGSVLRSEELIARRERFANLDAVGVLSKPDELLYLAVHAAAHRFIRLGWLYDMRLIIEAMSASELETAALRAQASGYSRLLAFTAELLHELLGVPSVATAKLGRLDRVRSRIVSRIVREPRSALKRSMTRFAYGVALCDSMTSAVQFAASSSLYRARLLVQAARSDSE